MKQHLPRRSLIIAIIVLIFAHGRIQAFMYEVLDDYFAKAPVATACTNPDLRVFMVTQYQAAPELICPH